MAKSKGYTLEQKNEMKVAYEGGTRLRSLAETWGVSVPTMAKYVRSAGGTLRNAGTPRKVTETAAELPSVPVVRRILP